MIKKLSVLPLFLLFAALLCSCGSTREMSFAEILYANQIDRILEQHDGYIARFEHVDGEFLAADTYETAFREEDGSCSLMRTNTDGSVVYLYENKVYRKTEDGFTAEVYYKEEDKAERIDNLLLGYYFEDYSHVQSAYSEQNGKLYFTFLAPVTASMIEDYADFSLSTSDSLKVTFEIERDTLLRQRAVYSKVDTLYNETVLMNCSYEYGTHAGFDEDFAAFINGGVFTLDFVDDAGEIYSFTLPRGCTAEVIPPSGEEFALFSNSQHLEYADYTILMNSNRTVFTGTPQTVPVTVATAQVLEANDYDRLIEKYGSYVAYTVIYYPEATVTSNMCFTTAEGNPAVYLVNSTGNTYFYDGARYYYGEDMQYTFLDFYFDYAVLLRGYTTPTFILDLYPCTLLSSERTGEEINVVYRIEADDLNGSYAGNDISENESVRIDYKMNIGFEMLERHDYIVNDLTGEERLLNERNTVYGDAIDPLPFVQTYSNSQDRVTITLTDILSNESKSYSVARGSNVAVGSGKLFYDREMYREFVSASSPVDTDLELYCITTDEYLSRFPNE